MSPNSRLKASNIKGKRSIGREFQGLDQQRKKLLA